MQWRMHCCCFKESTEHIQTCKEIHVAFGSEFIENVQCEVENICVGSEFTENTQTQLKMYCGLLLVKKSLNNMNTNES